MQVIDFVCQLAIILFTTKMFGILMRKIGLPQVLGFIIAGLLVGPAIWGLFFDIEGSSNIFPIVMGDDNPYLKAFAEVGVIFVMFTAGLETKLEDLKNIGVQSLIIALGGVIVPLGLGTLVGYLFLPNESFVSWLFIGVIMTATSVGITVEVLRELGKLKTKVGTIIVSAAIIDDVLGVVVLSLALSLAPGQTGAISPVLSAINPNGIVIITILWILAFFVFAIGAGVGISKLFKWIETKTPHTRRIPILSIAVCFAYSFIAERVFGVADITGAYIAGIILSTNNKSAEYVDRKVSINSYTLFAPIFFASIGIKIVLNDLTWDLLWFSLVFVAVAILAKIIGCGGIARCFRFKRKDSLRIGIGMIARGEVALIVMEKGLSGGLISDEKYRVIVVALVLISSLLAPILLKLLYKNKTELPSRDELEGGQLEQTT